MTPAEKLFHVPQWDRTEFLWTYRDGIKTFQAEEISLAERVYSSYYFNRYVHSEIDIAGKVLRHFDGAVKVYPGDQYAQRLSSNMPDVPRVLHKPKVFRIDGNIDVDTWASLTSLFFKGNRMVRDYLDSK